MSTVNGAGEEPGFLPQDVVAAAVPCQLGHYLPDNAVRCFHVIMWRAFGWRVGSSFTWHQPCNKQIALWLHHFRGYIKKKRDMKGYSHSFPPSLIQPLTRSLPPSLIHHSLTYSFTSLGQSPTHDALTHSPTNSLTPSLSPSPTHSLTNSLPSSVSHPLITHSLTHPPTHPFTLFLIHPFTHQFTPILGHLPTHIALTHPFASSLTHTFTHQFTPFLGHSPTHNTFTHSHTNSLTHSLPHSPTYSRTLTSFSVMS